MQEQLAIGGGFKPNAKLNIAATFLISFGIGAVLELLCRDYLFIDNIQKASNYWAQHVEYTTQSLISEHDDHVEQYDKHSRNTLNWKLMHREIATSWKYLSANYKRASQEFKNILNGAVAESHEIDVKNEQASKDVCSMITCRIEQLNACADTYKNKINQYKPYEDWYDPGRAFGFLDEDLKSKKDHKIFMQGIRDCKDFAKKYRRLSTNYKNLLDRYEAGKPNIKNSQAGIKDYEQTFEKLSQACEKRASICSANVKKFGKHVKFYEKKLAQLKDHDIYNNYRNKYTGWNFFSYMEKNLNQPVFLLEYIKDELYGSVEKYPTYEQKSEMLNEFTEKFDQSLPPSHKIKSNRELFPGFYTYMLKKYPTSQCVLLGGMTLALPVSAIAAAYAAIKKQFNE